MKSGKDMCFFTKWKIVTEVCQPVYQQLNHWTDFFKNFVQIACQKLVLTVVAERTA
jgi:hypothetical protein